ncbi:MAG: deoxyribodipyrimidine photolyase [Phycisphaerae bacterium]|nr:deoxyribodipyrimidine photolyase [Phycisphaerae bacterium]
MPRVRNMPETSSSRRTIAWLRGDLRLDDHPALAAAMRRGDGGCLPIFISTPGTWRRHHWGEPKLGMIAGGVRAAQAKLIAHGLKLRVLEVESPDSREIAILLATLVRHLDIDEVHAGREFGVDENERDRQVAERLDADDRALILHEDQTILPVRDIRSGAGTPYTVFTPFRKKWMKQLSEQGRPDLHVLPSAGRTSSIESDGPLPGEITAEDLAARFPAADFEPGEAEPARRLASFLDHPIQRYHDDRDPPAIDGTSTLSPWLACGSLSPRRAVTEMMDRYGDDAGTWDEGPATWLSELVWRDFYRHVMDGIPRLSMNRPLHGWSDRVAWNEDPEAFTAWCEGRTGIAIVDAGMRQLAATGWMHNRVRMIVATFLAKHLLVDWRKGERFFLESLADADFPSNNGGWQWAASTGTDAAPYFRVFNPDTQRERFDADRTYVRRWAPDHLDGTAPEPMVELKAARARAIEAFKTAKNG